MNWLCALREGLIMSRIEHKPDDRAQEVILTRAENAPHEPSENRPGAKVVTLADVAPEAIQWVWPGFLAAGKVTLLSSDPGCGKSTLSIDIASRLSRGLPWPVTGERPGIGSTILLSAEDDPADTIRPRLDAAGGDPGKVRVITAMCDYDSSGMLVERSLNLAADICAIESVLAEMGDCRLLIIDPISAYMIGVDSHKNADVRAVLAPLAQMAQRHNVAILCITHLNKSSGKAIYRSIGSIAYTAAARLAFGVVKDAEDPHRRLLVSTKANIGPDTCGLAYQVVPAPTNPDVGIIEWEPDFVTEDAQTLFARETDPDAAGRDDGERVLESIVAEMLAGGAGVSFADIQAAVAEHVGKVGDKALRKVLKAIGATSGRDGFQGPVLWRLPEASPGT
jgi:putative DNA primase/helicase